MIHRNNKYILGCGISGLIYSFYNNEYTIISKDVGGKLLAEGFENTFYLHDNSFSRKLLADLDIKYKKETHTIKYLIDKKIKDKITEAQKIELINKKLSEVTKIEDTTLSTDDYYIPVLKIDIKKLLLKLTKNINIIKDEVIRITKDEIVCKKNRFNYSSLISTLPADIFWKLYNKPKKLKYKSTTFILCNSLPSAIKKMNCDLLYIVDKDLPFTRINKKNKKYLYEVTGDISKKEFLKYFDKKAKILNIFKDSRAIIFTNKNNMPPKNVKFIGRFAVWDHRYKTHNVVEDANKNYSLESVWIEQQDFNSNFFNYNLNDDKEKQRLLREFILNMIEEIGEFQRLVLVKNHRKFKKIDREEILEEWIDIFKYWAGIANIYGFTIDEFFRKFWEKSEKVRIRYEKYKNKETK